VAVRTAFEQGRQRADVHCVPVEEAAHLMTRRSIPRSLARSTARRVVATLTLGLTFAPFVAIDAAAAGRPAPAVSVVGLTAGARGDAVRVLQQALINNGIAVAGGADGIFGAATAAAVSSFQQAKGLAVTGAVDDATAAALGLVPAAPSPLLGLRIGSRGDAVRQLQQTLVQAGFDLFGGVDGVFGVATANALSQFQYARGLNANARVDESTLAALGTPAAAPAAPAAPPAPAGSPLVGLAPGSTGLNVKALQQRLLDLGVTVRGGADGLYGPATANALKQFQISQGLTATGKVDEATAAALADPKQAATPAPAASGLGFAVYGERGDRVRALQQALLNAGISFRGGADGIFGAGTAGAIVNFQKAKGLQVTGTVDQSTAQALGLQPLGTPAAPPPAASSVTLQAFPVQRPCGYVNTWLQSRGGGRIHEGTDVIAKEGQEVYAVADGRITRRYWVESAALTGNGLRITAPDGTYFFYAHLLDVAPGIELGVPVKAGQLIGHVGKTGNTTVAHLHFEVHPGGGAAIDPTPVLTAAGGC
jgi:peptidoglycan hydrolase-like protein with peptidoglycan-binding domain